MSTQTSTTRTLRTAGGSPHSHRSYALIALLLAGSTLLPGALVAQEAGAAGAGAVPTVERVAAPAPLFAPRVSPLLASLRGEFSPFAQSAPASTSSVLIPQDRVRAGPNIALMAVGGAALVTGLIIGGDSGTVIAIAGGTTGLVGLHRYLR